MCGYSPPRPERAPAGCVSKGTGQNASGNLRYVRTAPVSSALISKAAAIKARV